MTPLVQSATGNHVPPWVILAATALLAAGAYALSCWIFPYKPCRCCKGAGRHYRKDGSVLRLCNWWCKGSGRRLRAGRWVYNKVAARRRRAAS